MPFEETKTIHYLIMFLQGNLIIAFRIMFQQVDTIVKWNLYINQLFILVRSQNFITHCETILSKSLRTEDAVSSTAKHCLVNRHTLEACFI